MSVCPGLQQFEGGDPWQAVAASEGAGQDEDPPSSPPPTPANPEMNLFYVFIFSCSSYSELWVQIKLIF